MPSLNQRYFPMMNLVVINRVGILKITDPLKLTSSDGVDEINCKVLKNTRIISSVVLSLVFSRSLATGVVPDDWRTGRSFRYLRKAIGAPH